MSNQDTRKLHLTGSVEAGYWGGGEQQGSRRDTGGRSLSGGTVGGSKRSLKNGDTAGASLVAQRLRIHLPMQGTRVGAPVQEDPT